MEKSGADSAPSTCHLSAACAKVAVRSSLANGDAGAPIVEAVAAAQTMQRDLLRTACASTTTETAQNPSRFNGGGGSLRGRGRWWESVYRVGFRPAVCRHVFWPRHFPSTRVECLTAPLAASLAAFLAGLLWLSRQPGPCSSSSQHPTVDEGGTRRLSGTGDHHSMPPEPGRGLPHAMPFVLFPPHVIRSWHPGSGEMLTEPHGFRGNAEHRSLNPGVNGPTAEAGVAGGSSWPRPRHRLAVETPQAPATNREQALLEVVTLEVRSSRLCWNVLCSSPPAP